MVPTISKFDIRNTLPELQHDFCGLWNEITQEAHNRESNSISLFILKPIRQLYVALHQGTGAAPTAFDVSTDVMAPLLWQPSSYPLCNIAGHHSTRPSISLLPAVPPAPVLDPDHSAIHLLEQSSLHGDRSPPDSIRNCELSIATPDLTTVIATENPTDTPIILPTAKSETASPPLSPLCSTLQSSDTVDQQSNTKFPPPLVPGNQSSSPHAPIPGDTPSTDPLTFSASPVLQIHQTIPGPAALSSVPAEEITAPRETSVSQLRLARNEATFDTHNNSRTQEPPNIVEVPLQPDQLAMPVLDMPMDPLQDSLDT
ncbi:hypothetical protein BGW80DRAFT_1322144, partial [Lactifluus volemus]